MDRAPSSHTSVDAASRRRAGRGGHPCREANAPDSVPRGTCATRRVDDMGPDAASSAHRALRLPQMVAGDGPCGKVRQMTRRGPRCRRWSLVRGPGATYDAPGPRFTPRSVLRAGRRNRRAPVRGPGSTFDAPGPRFTPRSSPRADATRPRAQARAYSARTQPSDVPPAPNSPSPSRRRRPGSILRAPEPTASAIAFPARRTPPAAERSSRSLPGRGSRSAGSCRGGAPKARREFTSTRRPRMLLPAPPTTAPTPNGRALP